MLKKRGKENGIKQIKTKEIKKIQNLIPDFGLLAQQTFHGVDNCQHGATLKLYFFFFLTRIK